MDTQYRKKVVSDRIKRLREQRGWNQRELAKRAGVSQKGISSIENLESNRENPRIDTLEKIAQAFGMHLIELVYNLDPELFVNSKEAAQFAKEGHKLPSRERAVLFRVVRSLAEQQQAEKEGAADSSEKPLLPPPGASGF